MIYKNRNDLPKIEASDCGCLFEDDIRKKYDENGNSIYFKVGEKDVRSFVCSFEKGCSLKALLDRCSLMPINEKIAFFNSGLGGVGIDTTVLPKDATEAFIKLKEFADSNPDIAAMFARGDSFNDILKYVVKDLKTDSNDVKEVSEDVNE